MAGYSQCRLGSKKHHTDPMKADNKNMKSSMIQVPYPEMIIIYARFHRTAENQKQIYERK